MAQLALVRHGQSQWNLEDRFTGWWDVDLTPVGEDEARAMGFRAVLSKPVTAAVLAEALAAVGSGGFSPEEFELLSELGTKNYWTSPVPEIVNPYKGDGPSTAYTGTAYRSKHVGDIYDTSPYDPQDPPLVDPYVKKDRPLGINTADFVANLGKLIAFVAPVK